jgi:hypothetical protein
MKVVAVHLKTNQDIFFQVIKGPASTTKVLKSTQD